ncbi:NAD(P)H-dependent oxidoreductase [Halegenticoccus tardaugens]|uniref:NAD(P)H-dependent oxidoreductase n=1 Tax=Halegenticoccus tardaugens TaxID=2071624 RepID=UPI00100A90D2|nr:flagellar biosynthesis protein FlgA [Halegenticoccus tardaugens]
MLNIPSQLTELDEPIKVGVIGAGLFGRRLVDQVERAPGMQTVAIADLELDKAGDAFNGANVDNVKQVDGPNTLKSTIADGMRAIVDDGVVLAESDVDVVVEATGIPEVGARHAYTAIMNETHVVMVTVEADTVVGPTLAKLADRAGVTYSMAYGDQPALIAELYDWAQTVGLDVVAAGKGNPFIDEYRYGTPDDVFERWGFDEKFVKENQLNPYMYNSFLDGTKVAVEMCAVANATGMKPDVAGMHLPAAELEEIPEYMRPKEDGGLLENSGVVDTISSLHPDGSEVENDIEFGVWIVTTTPNEGVQEYLNQYGGSGMYVASAGKYQLFYRPFHLPGTETSVSVANAALRNEPTGVPKQREAEVVGAAKRGLSAGEELDGGGGYTVYGLIEDAETATLANHVPLELLDGATLISDVEKDEIVTVQDVQLDQESFLYRLRMLQESDEALRT